MSIEVKFYDFGKRVNSTKNPESSSVGTYQVFQCTLKDNTSLLNPTLILQLPVDTTMPFNVNYIKIETFNRYYFIKDWVSIRTTIWECTCEVDVCGTYREEIMASTQFVVRADSSNNTSIIDSLAVGTSTTTTAANIEDSMFTDSIDVLVGVAGNGTRTYYVMSEISYQSMIRQLLSEDYLDTVLPNWRDVAPDAKLNVNPLQFITCIKSYRLRLPRNVATSTIKVGWGTVNVDCYTYVPGTIWTIRKTLTAPTHPQIGTAQFLCKSPFTTLNVYAPPWGNIPINPEVVHQGEDTIICEWQVDAISGNSIMYVYGGNPRILLGSAAANLGVDMAVSQVIQSQSYGTLNAITNGLGIISSFATGNISGGIRNVTESFSNILGSMTPVHRAIGGVGSGVGYINQLGVVGEFQQVVFPNKKFVGFPLYRAVVLSTLTGFCICKNAEIGTSGTEQETAQIESIMEGGIYIE